MDDERCGRKYMFFPARKSLWKWAYGTTSKCNTKTNIPKMLGTQRRRNKGLTELVIPTSS